MTSLFIYLLMDTSIVIAKVLGHVPVLEAIIIPGGKCSDWLNLYLVPISAFGKQSPTETR